VDQNQINGHKRKSQNREQDNIVQGKQLHPIANYINTDWQADDTSNNCRDIFSYNQCLNTVNYQMQSKRYK
jgi:hypothetical protein